MFAVAGEERHFTCKLGCNVVFAFTSKPVCLRCRVVCRPPPTGCCLGLRSHNTTSSNNQCKYNNKSRWETERMTATTRKWRLPDSLTAIP